MDRIDVHAHFLPPFYRDALQKSGNGKPDGMPAIPDWDIKTHLELMQSVNITRSTLSISSPGTSLYKDARKSATLTRDTNRFAADLKKTHPDKIGFWASLPLPFINESLAEIETAFSEGADGITLLTNYQGHYLGDPLYKPIFKALDDRKAKIFIHPTMPCSPQEGAEMMNPSIQHTNTSATPLAPRYPVPMFEFFFDTARAAINLILQGVVKDNPALSFVLPHAGGALPPLLSRIASFGTAVPEAFGQDTGLIQTSEEEVSSWLNSRFYYDLAGAVFPGQLKGMLTMLGINATRLLYGTDYPFTPTVGVMYLADMMNKGLPELFGVQTAQQVLTGNAKQLLGLT